MQRNGEVNGDRPWAIKMLINTIVGLAVAGLFTILRACREIIKDYRRLAPEQDR